MAEQAELHRFTIQPQRGAHGGMILRMPKVTARDLLVDWNAWKQLLSRTFIDEWLLGNIDGKMSEVQVLADNGLGESGPCPFHGYSHLQIFPLDKEPMRCADAEMKKK